MNRQYVIVLTLIGAALITIEQSCAARWYDQDRTGTGRDLRMLSPRSYTSRAQWRDDRWNNRKWYTINRAPRGYYHLDEYSDEWCPDCEK